MVRTLYSQSGSSFLKLLKPMLTKLDSWHWIVGYQMPIVSTEWRLADPRHEELYERVSIRIPRSEHSSIELWKPGALRQLKDVLMFDEWTCLTGFKESGAGAISRATSFDTTPRFSKEFYKLMDYKEGMLALHVDGWWEFSTGSDEIFDQIQSSTPCREIELRRPDQIDWTPIFR